MRGYWEAIMWSGVYLGVAPSVGLLWYSMAQEADGFPLIGAAGVVLCLSGVIAYLIGGKMTGWDHLEGSLL